MSTSEPLHIAFVWHMHQPDYRSAHTGAFDMPWVRLHALKDYLDMVEVLSAYPDLHQTFNLVPSLVEQLETYASGGFADVYWQHTMKPAAELDPVEQAFVVERMCEHPDHPRARSHPRYLELARKRTAHTFPDWRACAATFTVDELRDLQVWFDLAWFDPDALATDPLRGLVERGRDFTEEDKLVIADVQADLLARTLPAYRKALDRGQIELSTTPYFHPILPLLCNSDSARVAASAVTLPSRRFAHPEDAAEHVRRAMAKHEAVFGRRPRGMWCSEQAVGEEVLDLLVTEGISWTISDETVLARSLSGAAARRQPGWPAPPPSAATSAHPPGGPAPGSPGHASPYVPYRLVRETGEMAIVFRDHTLSDLIGFAYQSWDSRDAAADLIRRLHELRDAAPGGLPLVTIALDGENAWEYYPHDGRDFLRHLYEGLSSDPALRCVTVSEHLAASAPGPRLDWLHTGSWIGGDLLTWTGDRAHCNAWDLLHDARDLVAARRAVVHDTATGPPADVESAWRHILVAEGSDWFWWFGDHHHTELDSVWDLGFRLHLQEAYRLLGEPVPTDLFFPILEQGGAPRSALPLGTLAPTVDGIASDPAEWEPAGYLAPDLPSTMQRSFVTTIEEVRFGWHGSDLCLLIVPGAGSTREGLEFELRVTWSGSEDDPVMQFTLMPDGIVTASSARRPEMADAVRAAWGEVVEISVPLDPAASPGTGRMGLVLRIGREGMTEHVFHSAGLASLGWRGR